MTEVGIIIKKKYARSSITITWEALFEIPNLFSIFNNNIKKEHVLDLLKKLGEGSNL